MVGYLLQVLQIVVGFEAISATTQKKSQFTIQKRMKNEFETTVIFLVTCYRCYKVVWRAVHEVSLLSILIL